MLLIEVIDTAEALIRGNPRSRSESAQTRAKGADHKAFADIYATMPDFIYHVVTDPDVRRFRLITVLQHFNDDLTYPWKLVYVMVTIHMGWW